MLEEGQKRWKKKIEGNKRLAEVKNPLRNFVEKEIPSIDLSQFPNRPQKNINLSIGDPTVSEEFRTHPSNLEILKKNVGKFDGYPNFQGYSQAREVVAKFFPSPGYETGEENVLIVPGGSMAIWASMTLLAEEGDNFLFPSPGFPLSLVIAKNYGIEPRFYHLQSHNGWKADLAEMEKLIDERTKFIYVNDPSNPLGACWSNQHKLEIIQLARQKNLTIIADQIYEEVTYEEPCQTFAQLSSKDVTIFKCSGLTKRWFGPGWRLGWLIIYCEKEKLWKFMQPLRRTFYIMPFPHTVMQTSLKEILYNEQNEKYLQERLQIMKKNQHLIRDMLEEEKYCFVGEASGALYSTIILDIQKFNEKIPNCIQFCKQLFAEENITIFPGEFFSSKEPFVRLTISCSTHIIEQFLIRFKSFCHRHLLNSES